MFGSDLRCKLSHPEIGKHTNAQQCKMISAVALEIDQGQAKRRKRLKKLFRKLESFGLMLMYVFRRWAGIGRFIET